MEIWLEGGRWSGREVIALLKRSERLTHWLRVAPRTELGPEDGLAGEAEGRGEPDNSWRV